MPVAAAGPRAAGGRRVGALEDGERPEGLAGADEHAAGTQGAEHGYRLLPGAVPEARQMPYQPVAPGVVLTFDTPDAVKRSPAPALGALGQGSTAVNDPRGHVRVDDLREGDTAAAGHRTIHISP